MVLFAWILLALFFFPFVFVWGSFYKAAVLCFDLQVRELKCYRDVFCVRPWDASHILNWQWHSAFLAVLKLFWELVVN